MNAKTINQTKPALTKQRDAVLQVVVEHEGHPTANEIYELSRKKLPSISFATVYNSIHYLKDAGLIAEISFAHAANRYDSISHRAWINTPHDKGGVEGLKYTLAADITGDVARKYGVLIEDQGIALRGLFVIDPEGVLRYKVVHDLNIGRSVEETLRVVQALQTGGLCQAEWKLGQETLKA